MHLGRGRKKQIGLAASYMVEIQGRHVSAELSSSGVVIQPSGKNHLPPKWDETNETMFEIALGATE